MGLSVKLKTLCFFLCFTNCGYTLAVEDIVVCLYGLLSDDRSYFLLGIWRILELFSLFNCPLRKSLLY